MFPVQVRSGIFPKGFFEQRRIVEFGNPRDATVEDRKRYVGWESEVRDFFSHFFR